jgi:hypothetical protein
MKRSFDWASLERRDELEAALGEDGITYELIVTF